MSETQRAISPVSRLFVLVSVRICLIVMSTCLQLNTAAIKSCAASLESIKDDLRCPTNLTEWNKKAQEMRCASYSQNCTEASDFVYHCLVNAWANGTIHVCAPTTIIFGGLCAEFSKGGARVQEHNVLNCTSCPSYYNSNKSYVYQECYENIKTPTTIRPGIDLSSTISYEEEMTTATEKKRGGETGNITEIILPILTCILFCVGIFVIVRIVRIKCDRRIQLRKADGEQPVYRDNSDTDCTDLEFKQDFMMILCNIVKPNSKGTDVVKIKIHKSEFYEKYAKYCLKPNIEPMNITGNWREDLGIQTAADVFNMKIYVVQVGPDETKTYCFLPNDPETGQWMKITFEKEKETQYKPLEDYHSKNEEDALLTYDDVFDLNQFTEDKTDLDLELELEENALDACLKKC